MIKPLDPQQDAFGHALLDHLEGRGGAELVERSDGHIDLSAGAEAYFAEPTGRQSEIAERAAGRVLDVGCGAGRYALYLQQRGRQIVGIDASPLAIDVCRRRGLKDARLLNIEQIDDSLGRFDTILMMGNNFGLLGSYRKGRRILKRMAAIVNAGGSIIAETLDPYQTEDADHLAYHAQNREQGRMGGRIRMRIRYKAFKTPWFDYLFASQSELEEIISGTGWRLAEVIEADAPSYVAVLEADHGTG